MKEFDKSYVVNGKNVILRAATPDDAAFVYMMRKNEKKNIFLNKISGGVAEQRIWLKSCFEDPYQIYFVILSKSNDPLGLVRIYDQREESFCWGSWMIKENAPSSTAIESAVLLYKYALDVIGFEKSHFDVRIGNDKVINFHKKFGALEVKRDQLDVYFEISNESIRKSLVRFCKYLPEQNSNN